MLLLNVIAMSTKFTVKRLMLPHYFQKIGFTVFFLMLAGVLGGMVCYWCGAFVPESSSWPFFAWLLETYNTPWVRTALNIIGLLSLAFITFSREKVEDEMMDRLRLSTIGAVAAAYLILYIVVSIVWSLCMTDGLRNYIVANGYEFGFYLRAEQLWLLYVIIFKLRVIIGNRRVPDELEQDNRSGEDGSGRRCQSGNGRRCQSGNEKEVR